MLEEEIKEEYCRGGVEFFPKTNVLARTEATSRSETGMSLQVNWDRDSFQI